MQRHFFHCKYIPITTFSKKFCIYNNNFDCCCFRLLLVGVNCICKSQFYKLWTLRNDTDQIITICGLRKDNKVFNYHYFVLKWFLKGQWLFDRNSVNRYKCVGSYMLWNNLWWIYKVVLARLCKQILLKALILSQLFLKFNIFSSYILLEPCHFFLRNGETP